MISSTMFVDLNDTSIGSAIGYDGYTSGSDSSSFCDSPVLPVSEFDDYDKTVPPANGQDYLRRVQ